MRQHAGVDTARVIFTLRDDVVQTIIADETAASISEPGWATTAGQTHPTISAWPSCRTGRGAGRHAGIAWWRPRVVVQLPLVLRPRQTTMCAGCACCWWTMPALLGWAA
ncbi:MAG: hypothetical protein R2851_02420 [Caldilineaceae bacterium]